MQGRSKIFSPGTNCSRQMLQERSSYRRRISDPAFGKVIYDFLLNYSCSVSEEESSSTKRVERGASALLDTRHFGPVAPVALSSHHCFSRHPPRPLEHAGSFFAPIPREEVPDDATKCVRAEIKLTISQSDKSNKRDTRPQVACKIMLS